MAFSFQEFLNHFKSLNVLLKSLNILFEKYLTFLFFSSVSYLNSFLSVNPSIHFGAS